MSSSLPKSPEGHLAEHHLGDRLAALVDGELGHDARERVLAHVATCAKCKAEVDEQRRLKNVFAAAAPPPPSESLLARLQGLPAGGGFGDGGSPLGGSPLPGGSTAGVFGTRRGERFEFAYAPVRRHHSAAAAAEGLAAARPSSRGLRLAFVAAGAVSLAAIALGGVSTVTPVDAETRAQGKGSNVTPARTQGAGAGAATTPDSRRRVGPLLGQVSGGQSALGSGPVVPTGIAAPLLPGVPSPHQGGATAVSPHIRPLNPAPPFGLSAWASAAGLKSPGLATASPSPSPTHSARTAR
ncbi:MULTISPECIES: anti-sigma factor family protein [unclassified Streptomyces]|uniref:anti-sigma factor family protein n=1 Tax=unclassified Streptomyces TaxID=2593676 RepID=UPI000490EFD3|nr:zf-HC2 domain-containing protein [Streptomyces sp. McG7]MDX3417133.1 zf-HC2 domain-containing protein [Streptomyces sp. MD20-1-1]MXQ57709.1 zf-HC2 domain-containing protein [Streptomyces sp. XHT-2]THC56070.1 zf-HC2 domain-containing protein [Streptomyces sp. Akac8]WSB93178.1 zf-HC2 domain-containing protein [Streptomyces cellulosae]